jgi:serine/threonine-protein kinase
MGEVYLAEHQRIERRAAIKVLAPELTHDAETVRRFFIEARAMSLVHHPGIVEVYDCDVHRNGRAYMVMEYLEGDTLEDHLARCGALPWRSACRIAGLVADAIATAHAKGVIHRDLKPGNVLLLSDADWRPADVKVLDFGLAKLLGGDAAGAPATVGGLILGTPEYMSPEQCSGARVDQRADVYSLGCMLFEMVAGVPPFEAESVRDLLAAQKFRKPPSLAGLATHAPAWLDDVVTQMLHKDPDHRPQAMVEVVARLASAGEARA